MRSADGLVAGSDEHRPLLEDLATFKRQLLAQQTENIAIFEAGRRLHLVSGHGGRITLEGEPQ